MWFGILGPLLVRDGDTVVEVPAARQRVLLAALLIRAGRTIPADVLAEMVWDGAPPAGAATTLRSHVMRLRRVLGPGPGARVVTKYPGYVLQAGEQEVDLLRFTFLCGEGGAAVRGGAWEQASELLGEALGLWRGEPLADVDSDLVLREGPRLAELRLQALAARIDADLHLGRHAEVIIELRQLAGAHPLREPLHALLMLALYRDGRQAEALAAYQHARRVLIDELGTEPGTTLRELHQRILTGDPTLAAPEPGPPATGGPGPAVPRELPPAVRHFTGRAGELQMLTRLLDEAGGETPGTVVISAIGGTAGVGKTALAVHWAHQVAERFPDGQLYVNLRGYDPDQPMPAADALAGFLSSLGVPGQDIPAEETDRVARYRSIMAGKRTLVILDNAGSAEQVRPLLPGSPACTVLVTSRDALADLVARDGAARLDLDLLPPADAVRLLRQLIGDRVDADPDTAAELAARCSRLPLALRIAAELAAGRPDAPLARLAGELADQQHRLDLLDAGGDPRTAVRAVFSWSCRHLNADAARTFRLLGLHPGTDYDLYAAAALTGATLGHARQVLGALARAHLIQPATPGRYGMHDLLRAYARELAEALDSEDEGRSALTRLFDYYLHTAATAMDTLVPAERHRRPRIPPPATPAPLMTDPAAVQAWLDTDRASLVAVAAYAADRGWPVHATRLAAIVFRYLDMGCHYPDAIIIHGHARTAARRIGDRTAEATALNALGLIDWHQGRYQQATNRFRQALALFRQTGDRTGQARALGNLGIIYFQQGRYEKATRLQEQAVDIFRETGDLTGEAMELGNLGVVEERQGRYEKAAQHQQQALALARETGDSDNESYALVNLGTVSLRQGRYPHAIGQLQRVLALFRETGDRFGEAATLTRIGDVGLRQGRCEQASLYHQQALALYREIGDGCGEADALNGLGEALLATGQPGDARAWHATALGLASQIGDKYEQARAHNGLAHTYHATGDDGQARHHWQEALTLYTALGVPEANQVRAQLAMAESQGHGEQ
jgi:DNA-binding SARP family transcriptional activator/Tfp pilus assembly protein PilF